MPRWFSEHELSVLDALTANNPTVLVSFGGTPSGMKSAEPRGREVEDEERDVGIKVERTGSRSSRSRSAVCQRAGSITRWT